MTVGPASSRTVSFRWAGRRRGRLACVAAVTFAGIVAGPGEAAAPKATILRAKSSASVEVTFSRPVSIDPEAVRVRGGHNYAGYYLHPLGGSLTDGTGALFLHGFRMPSVPHVRWLPLPVGLGDFSQAYPRRIPAGRYRLYVLADGPVEVRVPISGYAARTISATRRVRVAYSGGGRSYQSSPGTPAPHVAHLSFPITVVSNANVSMTALQVLSHGSYYTRHYSQPASCIGEPTAVEAVHASCYTATGHGQESAFHRGQYEFDSTPLRSGVLADETNHVYFPGRLTAGRKTAHFTIGPSTHPMEHLFAAALSFGL
jgi:hypothetical protein